MTDAGVPRVLLVDDNEATCALIAAILQREFAVEFAGDGNEAIGKLRTAQYAAVLLDLRMPRSDGFAVLDFLQEQNAAMLRKVLVVTASLTRGEIARARSYGVQGIVSKPFDVDTLRSAVRQCAGPADGGSLGTLVCSSTPMILIIADLLRQRLL